LIWGAYYIFNIKNQDEVFVKDFKRTWGLIYDWTDKVLLIPVYGLALLIILCKGEQMNCSDGKLKKKKK
jgi:hypothetical protein